MDAFDVPSSPIPDYLDEVLHTCGGNTSGANADYIPELAQADPDRLGVCVATADGVEYTAGDAEVEFTIQSISKPFVYALALVEHGLGFVLDRVGVEPSGEAFDELSLDDNSGRPRNPMINAGALTTHWLAGRTGDSGEERFERVRAGLSRFAGRELEVDEQVAGSELATAYRNVALANMLRSKEVFTADPDEIVEGYVRQCALKVTLRDLGRMAATLANGGYEPTTGERVVPPWVVRQVLSVMLTCGMYDGAGEWMSRIGFPAKSGVSGGILGVVPGQVGLATFSPRLDPHGNSVRGVEVCRRLSADMGMHIMSAPEPARSVIRRDRMLRGPRRTVRVCSLQGTIGFSGAERVLRTLTGPQDSPYALVLDVRRAYTVDDVARRMLSELLRRHLMTGQNVGLVDPHQLLPRDGLPEGVELLGSLERFGEHVRV